MYYLLLTTYYLLRIAYYLSLNTYYLLLTIHYLLSARCEELGAHRLLGGLAHHTPRVYPVGAAAQTRCALGDRSLRQRSMMSIRVMSARMHTDKRAVQIAVCFLRNYACMKVFEGRCSPDPPNLPKGLSTSESPAPWGAASLKPCARRSSDGSSRDVWGPRAAAPHGLARFFVFELWILLYFDLR